MPWVYAPRAITCRSWMSPATQPSMRRYECAASRAPPAHGPAIPATNSPRAPAALLLAGAAKYSALTANALPLPLARRHLKTRRPVTVPPPLRCIGWGGAAAKCELRATSSPCSRCRRLERKCSSTSFTRASATWRSCTERLAALRSASVLTCICMCMYVCV